MRKMALPPSGWYDADSAQIWGRSSEVIVTRKGNVVACGQKVSQEDAVDVLFDAIVSEGVEGFDKNDIQERLSCLPNDDLRVAVEKRLEVFFAADQEI